MESMYLNIEEIDKCINELEERIKKHPDKLGLKFNLKSFKGFRERAIEELERRKNEGE